MGRGKANEEKPASPLASSFARLAVPHLLQGVHAHHPSYVSYRSPLFVGHRIRRRMGRASESTGPSATDCCGSGVGRPQRAGRKRVDAWARDIYRPSRLVEYRSIDRSIRYRADRGRRGLGGAVAVEHTDGPAVALGATGSRRRAQGGGHGRLIGWDGRTRRARPGR